MKPTLETQLALTLALGLAACGGGGEAGTAASNAKTEKDRSEITSKLTGRITPEKAADYVNNRVRAVQDAVERARTQGPVPLPSHRRLMGFLPSDLPGRTHSELSSSEKPNAGRASADGRYRVAPTDMRRDIRIEIDYYGESAFNPTNFEFLPAAGAQTKIAGFDAVVRSEESSTSVDNDVHVRLDDALVVHASGSASVDDLKKALAAIDLKELKQQLDDKTLFEPNEVDLLAESILGLARIADLLPSTLGSLSIDGVQQRREVDEEPFFARASARYGNGELALFDYGTPDATQHLERSAAKLGTLSFMSSQQGWELTEGQSELEHGEAWWAITRNAKSGQAMVALRLFQGRFVGEYSGQFAPAPKGEMPEHMKEAMKEMAEQLGLGAFETPEAQVEAARATFEAIDLESLQTEAVR